MRPFRSRLLTVLTLLLPLVTGLGSGRAAAAQTAEEPAAPPSGTPEAPAAAPALAFDGDAIVATGLSPAGEVILFGVARVPLGYLQRIERFEEVLVADAAGEARLELDEPLPALAVWAAVDTTTGALATAPTPGFPRAARPFPTAGLHGGGRGVPARMLQAIEAAHVLYVRPGEGAWGIAMIEGGAYDADGADDGVLELELDRMVPVGASSPAPPTESLPGDVLVVVDPTDLSLFTLRVTPDVLHD